LSPQAATNGKMLPLGELRPQLLARLPAATPAEFHVAGGFAEPSRVKPLLRLMLATEIVPGPDVQVPVAPPEQRRSPVGSTRRPNELPMPWVTSKLNCSQRMPPPPRSTVLPLPNIFQAKPRRGDQLLWSPAHGLVVRVNPCVGLQFRFRLPQPF